MSAQNKAFSDLKTSQDINTAKLNAFIELNNERIKTAKSPEGRTAAIQVQRDVLKNFLPEITDVTLQTLTGDVVHRLIELHDNALHAAIRLEDATSMSDTATILMRQKELKEAEDNYRSNKIWSEEVTPLRDGLIKRHLDDYAKGLQSEIDRHGGKSR